jgi:hypothetical protein
MFKKIPLTAAFVAVAVSAVLLIVLLIWQRGNFDAEIISISTSPPIHLKHHDQKRQCAMEAKVCPDGNSVGRTGQNCEFAPCSGENGAGNLIGGDRDEHGCLGPAGYSWCEEKQKCLRSWEENCGTANMNDLKTYQNDEYGFAFQYSSSNCFLSQDQGQQNGIFIEIYKEGQCPTLKERGDLGTLTFKYKYDLLLIKKYSKTITDYVKEEGLKIKSQKNTKINNRIWQNFILDCSTDGAPVCYGLDIIYLSKDDDKSIIYEISAENESSARKIAEGISLSN